MFLQLNKFTNENKIDKLLSNYNIKTKKYSAQVCFDKII